MKDKKKFGGISTKPKNRNCKKFGYGDGKENRKYWRMEIKRMSYKQTICFITFYRNFV